jgi:hypothetical protein
LRELTELILSRRTGKSTAQGLDCAGLLIWIGLFGHRSSALYSGRQVARWSSVRIRSLRKYRTDR